MRKNNVALRKDIPVHDSLSWHNLWNFTEKQIMDNPRKKKADSKRVSQQPHEQAYQKRKAKASGTKNPGKSNERQGNNESSSGR